jgi:hypothetical protein
MRYPLLWEADVRSAIKSSSSLVLSPDVFVPVVLESRICRTLREYAEVVRGLAMVMQTISFFRLCCVVSFTAYAGRDLRFRRYQTMIFCSIVSMVNSHVESIFQPTQFCIRLDFFFLFRLHPLYPKTPRTTRSE